MSATVRCFVAIELGPLLPVLSCVEEALRRAPGASVGRWVRPEGIHLTLQFLGDVAQEDVPKIVSSLRRACRGHEPFTMRLSRTGCFPNSQRPRVLWVGVEEPTGALAALQRSIEGQLTRLGFERDRRGFHPHLTVARIQRNARAEEARSLTAATLEYKVHPASLLVDAVSLMRSQLGPGGAVYTSLERINLST